MGIIQQLSKEVVERIAAGEVVERPASVVKELVENAIDAGATAISVAVEDGGRGRIAVIDNGSGMDKGDLRLSVEKHATSKIRNESDLWKISTMGFRGEALAAIGAVSKLSIESRVNRTDVVEGARIEVDGGKVKGPIVHGCAGGTSIQVSDIFFNVPARQKFLRSPSVEYGHISDIVSTLALAFPDIRFELSSDGKRKFISSAGDLSERVASIIGERIRGKMIEVSEGGDTFGVRGWVAEGGRAGGKDIHIFINKRPVRDRLIMHAISSAFGERLGRGEFPASALWIEIDPAEVDVNVHPTKREVRFVKGGAVHDFVAGALKKALETSHASCVVRHASCVKPIERLPVDELGAGRTSDVGRGTWDVGRKGLTSNVQANEVSERPTSIGGLKVLGQLDTTYVVCEGAEGTLVLIDQHAAHERLGYDNLLRQHASGSVARQQLLIPERVELGEKWCAYIMERADALASAGFEIEPFGGGTIIVKAVPAILGSVGLAHVFEKLAHELEEIGSSVAHEDVIEKIFAVVACHRQVRAGDSLSNEELRVLIRDIERENITHCPHGRPAIVRIEKPEIEKWFKRRG